MNKLGTFGERQIITRIPMISPRIGLKHASSNFPSSQYKLHTGSRPGLHEEFYDYFKTLFSFARITLFSPKVRNKFHILLSSLKTLQMMNLIMSTKP